MKKNLYFRSSVRSIRVAAFLLTSSVASMAQTAVPSVVPIAASPATSIPASSIPPAALPNQWLDQGPLVIRNVNLFDGITPSLQKGVTVLAELVRMEPGKDALDRPTKGFDIGYFIKEISKTGDLKTPYDRARARVIDGQGKTLMPGLIDTHVHLSWANLDSMIAFSKRIQQKQATSADYLEAGTQAALEEAEATLLRGFTSVREVGGIAHLARKQIDPSSDNSQKNNTRLKLGKPGPRIWASGAVISATGGHADAASDFQADGVGLDMIDQKLGMMTPEELELWAHKYDDFGLRIADGVPQVLKAVRDQFVKGANQIKITTGGGISTPHDPIDLQSWTQAEIDAAVETARGYNTYVTTHQYTGVGIIRDLKSGVRMVEHANILDDNAAKYAASLQSKKDARGRPIGPWLSISPFFVNAYVNPKEGIYRDKQGLVQAGTLASYGYAKKYRFENLAFGSDPIMVAKGGEKSPKILAQLPYDLAPLKQFRDVDGKIRDYSYSNFEIIRMATGNNGRVLTMSGPRTPYKGSDSKPLTEGFIGVLKPGAVADMILVDGNPLVSLDFLYDVKSNIRLIVKDGVIYKNTL
jgi:imidazolonepropionase-like amidohydrolase